ncbi:MAG: hypothetical protein LBC42_02300, partial [Puniceicoccales bacterium]|nr:hypothetical protein [Puniceicoccales bacterium]
MLRHFFLVFSATHCNLLKSKAVSNLNPTDTTKYAQARDQETLRQIDHDVSAMGFWQLVRTPHIPLRAKVADIVCVILSSITVVPMGIYLISR